MKHLILPVLLASAVDAQVPDLPATKEVPVNDMNYVCKSKGALFWLSHETKQMFVGDPGLKNEGFELTDVEVKAHRCMDTFDFTGSQMVVGHVIFYVIKIQGCSGREKIMGSAVTLDKKSLPINKPISLECKRIVR
ncbi:MAG: hypothetical protein A4S09_09695 [Proteobacteria bacterium SG_bin7]|nr:MAG: hypothetical protein A4S09_09695 [Proteobacteria bacterium SG_bin7]